MGVRLHVTKLGKATVVIVFENSSLWVPIGCFWFCLTCFYKFPHQTQLSVLLLHLICTVFVEFSFLKDLVVMIHLLVYHFQNHPCLYQSPSKRKYTPQEVYCIYYIDHLCQVHSLLALNQVILYQQFGLWQEDFICREFKSTKKIINSQALNITSITILNSCQSTMIWLRSLIIFPSHSLF